MDVAPPETASKGLGVLDVLPWDSTPETEKKDSIWQSLWLWMPERLWRHDFCIC
jgi:hypothetical protein